MVSSFYKWLIFPFLGFMFFYNQPESAIVLQSLHRVPIAPPAGRAGIGMGGLHPLHMSVVEINHNAANKTLEISCKLFTDDFEKVLTQNYKTRVDLINPPIKAAMDTLVKKYILSHLSLIVDGKPRQFTYVGFEHENEAVYGYVQIENISSVNKIDVTNKLMQDLFTDQINLIHVIVGGNRKSTKLEYPASQASFKF